MVRQWATELPPGAATLELGCGHGVPISATLLEVGLDLSAVDASPALVAEFQRRFPEVPAACETVEDSPFFGRTFDAAIAVGLIFLLDPDRQVALIHRVAGALRTDGRFLFSAPTQTGSWPDLLTSRPSASLGRMAYERALAAAGFRVVAEYQDEGGNHYYDVRKG